MILFLLLFFLNQTNLEQKWNSAVKAYEQELFAPALYSIEALLLYEEFTKRDSAFLLAAEASLKLGYLEKASIYYKKFLKSSKNPLLQTKVLTKAIEVHLTSNTPEEAYQLIQEFNYIKPDEKALEVLGRRLEEEGKWEKAGDIYRLIDSPSYYLKAIDSYMKIDLDKALELTYEGEKKFSQEKEEFQFLKFSIFREKNDTLMAINTLLELGTEDIASLSSKNLMEAGNYLYNLHLYDFALKFLTKTREIEPKILLSIYRKKRDYNKIKEIYLKSQKLTGEERAELEKIKCLAKEDFKEEHLVYANIQNPEEAISILERLFELNKLNAIQKLLDKIKFEDYRLYKLKGELNFRKRNFNEAKKLFEKYLDFAVIEKDRNKISEKIFVIKNFYIKNPEEALQRLVKVHSIEEKCKILFTYAKDYYGTISLCDTLDSPLSLYYTALAYKKLGKKENKKEFQEHAEEKFKTLFWNYPEDTLAEYALSHLFDMELKDTLMKYQYGLDYLDYYPEGKFYNQILYKLSLIDIQKGNINQAFENLNLLCLKESNEYTFPALYTLALLLLSRGDTLDAISKLQIIKEIGPQEDSLKILTLFKLAELYQLQKENIKACYEYALLQRLLNRLPPPYLASFKASINSIKNPEILEEIIVTDPNLQNYINFKISLLKHNTPKAKLLSMLRFSPIGFESDFYYAMAKLAEEANLMNIARESYEWIWKFSDDENLRKKGGVALAETHIRNRENEKAIDILTELVSHSPEDALILSRLVVILYRKGDIEKADSLWEALDKKAFIDASPLLLEKVGYFLKEGAVHRADSLIFSLKKFRDLANNEHFLYYQALVKFKKADYDSAIQLFLQFKNSFGSSQLLPQVNFKLGTAYFKKGLLESSIIHYEKVLQNQELRRDALINLGIIYKQKNEWERLREICLKLLKEQLSQEERVNALFNLGYSWLQQRRFLDAINYFKSARKVTQNKELIVEITYWIAECYFGLGQYNEAISEFSKICEIADKEQEKWRITAQIRIGRTYELLEDYKSAREIYIKILKERGEEDQFGKYAKERLNALQ